MCDFGYKKAYQEMKEVFETLAVQKALIFAAKNPKQVYGKDSEEYNAVVHGGYFDLFLYLSTARSTADKEGK